jgi:predicted DNA-binding protein with PD1-like motif
MRAHAFRLTPRVDLKAELARLTEAHALGAGCIVSCVGSLSHARLRTPGAIGEAEVVMTFVEPMEIVSLSGTLCADGLHLHASLSRGDGSCVGGHLVEGCIVNTTAELVIGELSEVEFHRPRDPATGYNELSVQPRRRDGEESGSESRRS